MRLCTYILILFLTACFFVQAQSYDNRRYKQLHLTKDSLVIDTVSLVPSSVVLKCSAGHTLEDSLYIIDYAKSLLITQKNFREQYPEISIKYRTIRHYMPGVLSHKDDSLLQAPEAKEQEIVFYRPSLTERDIYGLGGLNSSGSISRGISVGNRQDVVVNSSLNLQLSGKLTDDLNIAAAITDNNIPLQPDGTTQQLQEFDKVFIQLYNNNFRLTAGDYDITGTQGHFLRFSKKAQGGRLDLNYDGTTEKGRAYTLNSTSAAAIAKGRYARNHIEPIEGNQGPYKLRGEKNELYIIILAGTERVYIDGQLLQRGQSNDYIIDYNTAEITFMPQHLITKDRRIIVEFEYSDKNYARSMFYSGSTVTYERFSLDFNFFSEQDMKNQTLFQELSPEDKMLMSQIGDSLHLALIPHIDSMGFDNSYVMYKMIDTIVDGFLYDSVYVYSTNPDSAHYRLGFSNVGEGRGDYKLVRSAANGRVFEWVAPVNGISQGSYEPVTLLTTPQKQQMFTIKGGYQIAPTSRASVEMAISNNDKNTFSDLDNKNNSGLAMQFLIEDSRHFKRDTNKRWQLNTSLMHEWAQSTFKPVERYRNAEFNRDWNLEVGEESQEHLTAFNIRLEDNKNRFFNYRLNSFLRDTLFQGLQNVLHFNWQKRGFFVRQNASLTQTETPVHDNLFFRNHTVAGHQFRYFTLGLKIDAEDNRFQSLQSDSLMPNSQKYEQFEVFVQNPDTTKNTYTLFYRLRNDFYAREGQFKNASKADEAGFSMALNKNPNSRFALHTAYRHLYNVSDFLQAQGVDPDRTVLGRLEYSGNHLSGLLSLNTFYETGTGLEVKREFTYVEVQPGQGVYKWTDYNNNGIKELDEFEVAAFQDEANYIRVYTPTGEYIKAYTNQFNQIVNILPNALWRDEEGLRKFLARFANRTNYQLHKKTLESGFAAYNPFDINLHDSVLLSINSGFRNNLSFNTASPVWGADYTYSDNRSKMLLVNGFEGRSYTLNNIKTRWNISRSVFFNTSVIWGEKARISEFFPDRDYHLMLFGLEPSLSYQRGSTFRNTVMYKYDEKENSAGTMGERAVSHSISNKLRYSRLERGSLSLRFSYVQIQYNAPDNTSLAYEMLEGLRTGHNYTWSLMYQRNLKNNMQLSFIYDGRKPYELSTIHHGSVQLRAFF